MKKCLAMVEVLAEKKDDYFVFTSGAELMSLKSAFRVSRCSAPRIMKLGNVVNVSPQGVFQRQHCRVGCQVSGAQALKVRDSNQLKCGVFLGFVTVHGLVDSYTVYGCIVVGAS